MEFCLDKRRTLKIRRGKVEPERFETQIDIIIYIIIETIHETETYKYLVSYNVDRLNTRRSRNN